MNALTLSNARRCVVGATLVAAAFATAPAGAQNPAPAGPGCFGHLFKDKVGDAARAHPSGVAGSPENLDLVEGWFTDDGTKATAHVRVKDLMKAIPEGSSAIQWQVVYGGSTTGALAWVRAAVDFTGLVTYDYGGQEQIGITWNIRQGGTTGNFAEGANGVVSIDIPDQEKKGTVLKGMVIHAYEAVQVIPSAAPTPVKGGQLYEADNATGGKYQHTVGGPCPAAPAAPAITGGLPPAPVVGNADPLKIKVATKSIAAKKSKKSFAVKLSSNLPLTKVGAQLVKGKKVFAKGSLAKLGGNGTMKLKVTKKLKKGSYRLDIVGTDATGARRVAAAALKVK